MYDTFGSFNLPPVSRASGGVRAIDLNGSQSLLGVGYSTDPRAAAASLVGEDVTSTLRELGDGRPHAIMLDDIQRLLADAAMRDGRA